MGVPCDEILGNHSKGLPGCFYTLWADNSRALAQRLSSFFVLTVRRRWLLLELRAVEHAGEQH